MFVRLVVADPLWRGRVLQLRPHVPGVDIGRSEAHPVAVKPKDGDEWKRGPGMYGVPEFIVKEAPAWDFAMAPGRPKTVLDEPGCVGLARHSPRTRSYARGVGTKQRAPIDRSRVRKSATSKAEEGRSS